MKITAPAFTNSVSAHHSSTTPVSTSCEALSLQEVSQFLQDWLYEGQFSFHSPRTTEFRRHVGDKLIWFLKEQNRSHCETSDLRQFLAYAVEGHLGADGRWGNARMTKPLRSATVHRYYRELRAFFSWVVKEERLQVSPMAKITPPQMRTEQVQPFTHEHQSALFNAARRTTHPRRDEAILLFLLDTGCALPSFAR